MHLTGNYSIDLIAGIEENFSKIVENKHNFNVYLTKYLDAAAAVIEYHEPYLFNYATTFHL